MLVDHIPTGTSKISYEVFEGLRITMFSNFVNQLIESQIRNKKMEESDRELYQYGYNMLIFEIMNFLVLILIGLLFQCLIHMALYAIVYIPLRSYAGGYHASTPIGCMMFSAVIELIIAVSLRISLYEILLPHIYLPVLAAQIIIWIRTPVAAVNKPIGDNQRRKFRRRSRTILLFEAVALVLCMENHVSSLGYVIASSHILLSVMMLLPQRE